MNEIRTIGLTDVLHKTTYIWKEDSGCIVIINTEGNKVIINAKAATLWKEINDESSVSEILEVCNELNEEEGLVILEHLKEAGLITNEDLIWGNDLLKK